MKNKTEILEQLICRVSWTDEIHKQLIFISALDIFLSVTAFLGNTLILIALRKESSLHPPSKLLYRCLATTDVCFGLILGPSTAAYWISLVHEDWKLCRYALAINFVAGCALCLVSLLTMAAISVDRLLALLLRLEYRQVVTLKRTYVAVIIFWLVSTVARTSYFTNRVISLWCFYIVIPVCLVAATFSYTKIFHTFRHNHNQMQVHVQQQQQQQQQSSQPVPLNIARYRKVVYSALWVQLALVVCYLPFGIAVAVLPKGRPSSFQFIVYQYTTILLHLNSSINPFLYCWKISEVRQAVKETIRQELWCPWS